jgi:uncharacterized protein (DUF302 family)
MRFFCTYASMGFADAVAATKKALKRQRFTILSEIDIRQVLKEVSPSILRPHLILSACSLPLAYRAIKVDDVISSMLLCEVVIQEHNGDCVKISVMDPACTIGAINHVEMISIAEELRSLVQEVMDDIASAPKFHRAA